MFGSCKSFFVIVVVCFCFNLRLHALVRALTRSCHFCVLPITLDKTTFILSHFATDDRTSSVFVLI